MLGYDSNNDGAMEFWNGTQPVDFVQLLSDIIHAYQIGLVPEIVSGCTWGDEGPFRAKGVTAAVQIQAYHTDLDPYNHTIQDTYEHINQNYIFEQIKGTTAIAGHLAVPMTFNYKFHLPMIWFIPI